MILLLVNYLIKFLTFYHEQQNLFILTGFSMSSAATIQDSRFSLTNTILPTWRKYSGLDTTQKIIKIAKDLFKTVLCIFFIIPFIIIDSLKKKNIESVTQKPDETAANENRPILIKLLKPMHYLAGLAFFSIVTISIAQRTGIIGPFMNPITGNVINYSGGNFCWSLALLLNSSFLFYSGHEM